MRKRDIFLAAAVILLLMMMLWEERKKISREDEKMDAENLLKVERTKENPYIRRTWVSPLAKATKDTVHQTCFMLLFYLERNTKVYESFKLFFVLVCY